LETENNKTEIVNWKNQTLMKKLDLITQEHKRTNWENLTIDWKDIIIDRLEARYFSYNDCENCLFCWVSIRQTFYSIRSAD